MLLSCSLELLKLKFYFIRHFFMEVLKVIFEVYGFQDVMFCQKLSEVVRRCQKVSKGVKKCQKVAKGVKRCQKVSKGVKSC